MTHPAASHICRFCIKSISLSETFLSAFQFKRQNKIKVTRSKWRMSAKYPSILGPLLDRICKEWRFVLNLKLLSLDCQVLSCCQWYTGVMLSMIYWCNYTWVFPQLRTFSNCILFMSCQIHSHWTGTKPPLDNCRMFSAVWFRLFWLGHESVL